MAIIKPFECIRPAKELADKIAALPYDVYNRQEAYEKVKGDKYSFLRIDRAETQFDEEIEIYDERVYKKANEILWKMVEREEFITDSEKGYYIYELIMDGRSQTGIVACASIDDYLSNVIKKHENTREEKEIDRINHVDKCNAQTGPIFLAYRSQKIINDVVNKVKKEQKEYGFVSDDGVTHNVWKIRESVDVETIEKAFSDINEIYIADGHHRAASAVKVGLKRREENPNYTGKEEFNYFLSVLFPDEQLMIMPYNRAVRDLNGLSKEAFIDEVSKKFVIEEVGDNQVNPAKKAEFGMYLDNSWYRLIAKDDLLSEDPVEGLDVSILQNHLLEAILGIKDPRVDSRIDFIGGIRGLDELEKRVANDMTVAFSMYATTIKELFDVADAKMLMPPKSTWFEPKLRSGLFIHKI